MSNLLIFLLYFVKLTPCRYKKFSKIKKNLIFNNIWNKELNSQPLKKITYFYFQIGVSPVRIKNFNFILNILNHYFFFNYKYVVMFSNFKNYFFNINYLKTFCYVSFFKLNHDLTRILFFFNRLSLLLFWIFSLKKNNNNKFFSNTIPLSLFLKFNVKFL